jgi:acyl carrier protein
MRIIREQEKRAFRDRHGSDDLSTPLAYELNCLREDEARLVSALVASARRNYIKNGVLQAVADLKSDTSDLLINNKQAEELIAQWLRDEDPSLEPTVKIGPDRSGNIRYATQAVVTFDWTARLQLREAIRTGIADVIEEATGIKAAEITEDKHFIDDLDIDSLSMVLIAVEVEDKYKVAVPDEDLASLYTVERVISYILQLACEQPVIALELTERISPQLVPVLHDYLSL